MAAGGVSGSPYRQAADVLERDTPYVPFEVEQLFRRCVAACAAMLERCPGIADLSSVELGDINRFRVAASNAYLQWCRPDLDEHRRSCAWLASAGFGTMWQLAVRLATLLRSGFDEPGWPSELEVFEQNIQRIAQQLSEVPP